MLVAIMDTHALLWHLYSDPKLSARAENLINDAGEAGDRIGVSAMSLIEVIYLQEKNRIPSQALARIDNVLGESESVLLELPINRLIAMSVDQVDRQRVPDLPDRIIAATALVHRVPLITRDRLIVTSGIETIW
ncbi:MAG: PIN domain-containing protein [Sphaerobacteraceae bacterium]|nr:MAG: PIN domain-containing protein [Sphaerobacteraceae bacterium]